MEQLLALRSCEEKLLRIMAGWMSFLCHRNNLFLTGLKATLLIFMYNLSGVSTERVIVDPHITAILGKKIELMCVVHVQDTLTQISWEKVHNGGTPTLAVFNPTYGISIPEEYRDKVSFKSPSVNDATLILEEVSFTDAGEYTCKVMSFPYGNTQAWTTVTVMDPPPTTTTLPTTPPLHTTAGITSLAATKRALFTSPTLESLHEGRLGTIIGGAVGGALFLILLIILVGVCYMKKRRTCRGDCYTEQYKEPSDMQKESLLDILQPHELQQYNNPNNDSL